ncbi:MAG: hypothetical protein K8J09_04085 [Planctomycetes bacterium]|nr:hypothetical protein [Planctomycetota bacterium]MCC7398161.1 hypothetical protein [Planctomycetota bacterium]
MNHRHFPTVLSLLFAAAPAFAQDHDLKIAAKKGSTVWLLQETKNEQSIEMMGQQMESGQNITHTLRVTVKDIDDKGNFVVETTIARIHGAVTVPMMGDVDFDSLDAAAADEDEDDGGGMGMPSPGALKKGFTHGAGKSYTVKVSPKGKVVGNVAGVDEIAEGADNPMGPSMDEGMLHRMVESAFATLPEKPIAVGGKWNHESGESGTRMPMQAKLELTLVKVDDESYEIGAAGTIDAAKKDDKGDAKPDAGDEDNPMAEMMKNMKVKNGKITGTTRLSRADGFVIESKSVTSMDIEMEGEMSMSISTKMTTTTKRTTEAAALPKAAKKEAATEGGK